MGEIEILRIAALLHDIGKFWQGAGGEGRHEELSDRFIKQFLPETLQEGLTFVASHHKKSMYMEKGYKRLKILVIADWLSSEERRKYDRETEKGERKSTPMRSIFSAISLPKREKAADMYLYPSVYSPTELEEPTTSVDTNKLSENYKKLWNAFTADIKKIKTKNLSKSFETIFYLLKKYCTTVPAAVYKTVPDISLFDHAKTTCAIADCIYKTTDLEDIDIMIRALLKSRGENLLEIEKDILSKERFILIGETFQAFKNLSIALYLKRP